VLKVLEEHHVVPDVIVGTSMGSIVGGLYAAGYSTREIEGVLREIDWDELFFDKVARKDRSYRRKQDDTPYFIPFKLRFEHRKPYIPSGLLGGQSLELLLRRLVVSATTVDDFDDLPIPFRAVAMDLSTSEAVVLGSGNLADAIRASMSVPGAFPPVEIDGRQLVDGGSAANLPIRVAQDLGAESIIAVNISTPLNTETKDRTFLEVLNQLTAFLTSGSVQEDIRRLRPGDVLIQPDLGDINFKSFDRATEAVAIGEEAANEVVDELVRFSAPPERWTRFVEVHVRHDATALPVEAVEVNASGWVDPRIAEHAIRVPLGQPLDEDKLEHELTRLRGLEWFGMMRYDLEVEDQPSTFLKIDIEPKQFGRANVQVGASVRTDFSGDSGYTLMARYQWLAINRRGGEWVNVVQIGERSLVYSEFHQPLDWGLRWYAKPRIQTARENLSLWFDGMRVTEYRIEGSEAAMNAGRYFGNWGDLQATVFRGMDKGSERIGLTLFPSFDEDTGGVRLQFSVDTRDLALFPRSGTELHARAERDLTSFGASANQTVVDFEWRSFFTVGRSTVSPRADVKSNISGGSTFSSAVFLGGFRRLSGLGDNELVGLRGGVGGVDYAYEMFTLGQGPLSTRVYAGLTLETGNTYLEGDPVTWSSLRPSAAVWVGAASPLGPAYLGWGWTDPDRNRFYLILGERF